MSEHAPVDGIDVSSDGAWLRPSPDLLRMRLFELAGITLAVAVVAGVIVGLTTERALRRDRGRRPRARGTARGAVPHAAHPLVGVLPSARTTSSCATACSSRGCRSCRTGGCSSSTSRPGPAERLFELSTLHLHTAAAATDARIPGLEAAEAARLRDRLAALGEARAAGL